MLVSESPVGTEGRVLRFHFTDNNTGLPLYGILKVHFTARGTFPTTALREVGRPLAYVTGTLSSLKHSDSIIIRIYYTGYKLSIVGLPVFHATKRVQVNVQH